MTRDRHDSMERRLARLERSDPAVARAAESYRKMVRDLTGGPGLSSSELARLYDVSQPLPEELLPVATACVLCKGEGAATHKPCCSSHGHELCCDCYRQTHFVEVGSCCEAYTEREILSRHARDTEESPGQS